MEKKVTEKQLLSAFDDYLKMLAEDKKVSSTEFQNMQVAIVGCKYLVNDLFGSSRKLHNGIVK